ncbi:hypothetical protein R7Q39_19585 [Vibrio sp. 947]|uniref:hypothetical protein n=1 Tax=unclassified Vibrio TaxID=2614977 RepID=UPI002964A0BB|nr:MULTISPECIES: hypothetical protein [unclassified Vibrio]MDW1583262.1 hypothetical protein [Vibrio sp. Vb2897]MDW1641628.1 hypothetical protein [Vibrio sp. Vb2896]MDW1927636.1 hypothetical protein [Vibrio sp. 947]
METEILKQDFIMLEGENVCKGDPGYIEPGNGTFNMQSDYPVERLIHLMDSLEEWKVWYNDEVKDLSDIRGEDYFEDMLKNPIRDPVYISEIDGKAYIWDGWHRVAASIKAGRLTLPAAVMKH